MENEFSQLAKSLITEMRLNGGLPMLVGNIEAVALAMKAVAEATHEHYAWCLMENSGPSCLADIAQMASERMKK